MKGQSGSYPSAWQEKNHVLKVSFYCTNQKSQREAKSQGPGIFPWPLRCANDQSWLWEAHQGHYVHSPRLDTLQNVRCVRVCAHSGSLHPGQEPKASPWTMKSQYDRIMKLAKKKEEKWWYRCQGAFSWFVQLLLAELHSPTDLFLTFCQNNPGIKTHRLLRHEIHGV